MHPGTTVKAPKTTLMKNILAVIIGIITGAFFIAISVTMARAAFPADVAFPQTIEEQKAYMQHVPTGAKVLTLIGWLFSAFITGAITSLIQGRTSWKVPVVTAAVLQLLIWMSMMGLSYPGWMWLFATLLFIPMAYAGHYFFRKRTNSFES